MTGVTPTIFLGSYPPRECGIATYLSDVVASYDEAFGLRSAIVAIDEPGANRRYDRAVFTRLIEDDRASYRSVASQINAHPAEVLNVQHEYGLFGGPDGAWFLDLLEAVRKPTVVSLHTVLPEPSPQHRAQARRICELADRIVVLSQTGKDILTNRYGVDPNRTDVMHHGVPDVPFRSTEITKASFGVDNRMVISTFGLLGRGKGLEYAIEAMRSIVAAHPNVLYLILGQTHPAVRRREGESYRESLQALIGTLGLQDHVRLIDRYLEFDELVNYLAATDIYLTPYLNPAQIVSGTLAYAVGCGKAIVSTPYLYARELLAHERGFLCDFRDAASIARNVKRLLDDPALRRAVERRAYRFGRQMIWPNVARQFGELFSSLVSPADADSYPAGGATPQLVRSAS